MEKLRQTPSQTVGPFFAYGLAAEQYGYDYNSILNGLLIDEESDCERIYITGNIFDGNGNTVPDALLEFWQADNLGKYKTTPIQKKNDGFTGIGRLGTGTTPNHTFTFTTIKPKSPATGCAPHVNITLFMRGSLLQLYTRMYFPDENNEDDLLLNSVDIDRRKTLIAQKGENTWNNTYRFDIWTQGEKETVFFEI